MSHLRVPLRVLVVHKNQGECNFENARYFHLFSAFFHSENPNASTTFWISQRKIILSRLQ